MQRTRLDTLVSEVGVRFGNFFGNPWRTISVVLISLFFGFFIGVAIITTSGQAAFWDVPASLALLVTGEALSRWIYGQQRRTLWMNIINIFRIGVSYSVCLQAFIVGS